MPLLQYFYKFGNELGLYFQAQLQLVNEPFSQKPFQILLEREKKSQIALDDLPEH